MIPMGPFQLEMSYDSMILLYNYAIICILTDFSKILLLISLNNIENEKET